MLKKRYPVGWRDFSPSRLINFQLNRWHSMGMIAEPDCVSVGAGLKDFADWKVRLVTLARAADVEGRTMDAAYLYRAAEFLTYPDDGDKLALYTAFRERFDEATQGAPIRRLSVSYGAGALPVMVYEPENRYRGELVIHGGFDSFIEEFHPLSEEAAAQGYRVTLFEGPGQGGALFEHGLRMTPEWEKPVGAVLDTLGIERAALIGVSLGGYLALRAAAYDSRIKAVIAYDLIWNFYKGMLGSNPLARGLLSALSGFQARGLAKRLEERVRRNDFADWYLSHGKHIMGACDLLSFVEELRRYDAAPISPLVTQDVLLMAGTDDVWTRFLPAQRRALGKARSVECRVFGPEEHASHHCQVGNLGLALEVMLDWLDRRYGRGPSPSA